ncbi:MAG: DUF4154 domain-containing protein [Chlorobi bacterium]|nr:DUF4154 domain-containing protein [Chlorobiota bacterium]
MKAQKKYLRFFILLFLFSFIFKQGSAQKISEEAQRAEWIFNISYGITWQDEANITSYTIGVFSSKAMFVELQKQAKTKKIKGKPVEVIRYLNYKDIQANHIVYVSRNENAYLGLVYQKLKGKNVLIISNRSKQEQFSILNFRKIGDSKPFDINDRLAGENHITISRQLLKIGGSREVIQRIYAETNRKLLAEKKALEEKKKEIADKEKLLSEQEARIKAQRDSIASKENLISAKEGKLQAQNAALDSMSFEVLQQKKDLTKNQAFLKVQEQNIAKQEEFRKKLNLEILAQTKNLKDQEEKLKKNKEQLGQSQKTVATQKNIIYFAIAALVIFLFLGVIIVSSYINKQKVNKQLSEQYVAINSQKDEIQNQAKLLESVNTELEKLSIVASETDNAVTIMDVKGNFQWVNAGFTRLYGYTLQLLRNEIDDNIVGASSNPEVQNIISHIIETKQTGSYQNLSKTRNGNEIWVQTTITPILDENNEVTQLISIDTDITTEKKSEIEIRKQRDQIEIQNEEITSSINYAKTIQQAILPLAADLEKYFESFLIFKPRDVVSGDFYWFNEKTGKDGKPEKLFIATVDCTGHGVPGAFMSMIGSRLLSEIVSEQHITSPKDILEFLDKKVKAALRQETTDNNDGMDMAMCVIEKEDTSYHITYSGAKSDLYYYSHKNDDIIILSSERRSIGGTKQKRGNIKFTNKDFYLSENDIMWLSTDGIIDQNNADRKRFGTPKFIETLKEAKDLGLKEQKRLFLNKLDEHQGLEKQRDDITVWGIKFTDKW